MRVRRTLALLGALVIMTSVAASLAQDTRDAVERNRLQRQQQSDAFTLRSRQAAEETRAQSADRETRAGMRALHAEQRRQQDALHANQLHRLERNTAMPDTTPARQAAERAERARMEQESAAQLRHFDAQRPLGTPRRR